MSFDHDHDHEAWEEIAHYRVPRILSIPDEPEGLDPYGKNTLGSSAQVVKSAALFFST